MSYGVKMTHSKKHRFKLGDLVQPFDDDGKWEVISLIYMDSAGNDYLISTIGDKIPTRAKVREEELVPWVSDHERDKLYEY
jgi:hypothetical protein